MKYVKLLALPLFVCVISPVSLNSQPLAGTYTCANGNPGNAFDYGDLGDFFDELEGFGVSGAVTLEVYDDGGVFSSQGSYQLGFDGDDSNLIVRPVAGLGASNSVTIRAANGESPVVTGGGANGLWPALNQNVKGGMFFANIGFITLEGLEFTGGDFGVFWYNLDSRGNIRIVRCKVHDLTGPVAVGIVGDSSVPSRPHSVTIENNMFWNCVGPKALGIAGWGVVCSFENGTNWIVRNNTVVHVSTTGSGWDAFYQHGEVWADFSGNVVYLDHIDPMHVFNGFKPLSADRNVFYVSGQATIGIGGADWSVWQSLGLDPNGVNADPRLVSVTPGQEDLRLLPGSPARDLIPSSVLATDVFGNPRPYGSGYDAGAHEFSNFPAVADVPAGSAFSGPTGGPFSLSVSPGGALVDARIELSDAEAEAVTVTAITPPSPSLNGVAAPAIPAPGHPLLLEWSGASDLTNAPGAYTWTIDFTDAGSGYPMSCTVSITIPPLAIITGTPLLKGDVGITYAQIIQAENATGAVTFTVQAGTLPPGLSLSAAGDITGTPTQDGMFTFTIQAADNFTTTAQAYAIQVYPAPPPPPDNDPGGDSGCAVSGRHHTHLAIACLIALLAFSGIRRRLS